MQYATKVSAGGRVVIPVELRKELGIKDGDQVLLRVEDGAVRLWTKAMARKWAQDFVCSRIPRGRSLADELIEERRLEAARE